MAVKTTFSKEDFDKILSYYNLGDYKKSMPFKLGAVQTNLLLITTKGKFVFRYYETRSKNYALFEMNLLRYLSQKSYPCPASIKNKYGSLVGKCKNKPFTILEFMKGKHSKNVRHYKEVCRAIGKLHRITIGYKPKYHLYRDTYDQKSCIRNALLNSKKLKSKSEAKNRLEWINSELEFLKLQISNNLPKGVCHCDTHPSNFLYTNNKISAVLDFDDASYVPLLYDIANMIYFWAWPNKKKLLYDKTKSILKEYENYRKLTLQEKEHLYDLLKMVIFMSIGWFIHLDDDYHNGKRKIEFLNSIGRKEFYNKVFN